VKTYNLKKKKKKKPWPESASDLSPKSVQTFEDRGWHVVSVADPYGCILGFLDRENQ
jgi:hypothetical protein